MTKSESKSPVAEQQTADKEKTNVNSHNVGITILVFFLIIIFSGGFYLLWEGQQQQNIKQILTAQQITTLNDLQVELTTLNEEKFNEINSYQENLHNNLTNLIRNKEHLRNDWLIAEAEYLVRLANHRLLLEKDISTASVALKAADARLAEVADPALLSIRKILLNDLNSLSNIPTIDLAGLSVTLSSLSNNIPNLPLSTPSPVTHEINKPEKITSSNEATDIKNLPTAIWEDIKSLIIIRNHEKPLKPLLAPEQHFFLVQNLKLLLEQSRLALLNGNNIIYQERLETIKKWIQEHFDTQHNVTRNILVSLDELQKFDIDPTLPDISSTYSLIEKYRTQGVKPNLPEKEVDKKK